MKKITLILLFFIGATTFVSAQANKGLNFGIGLSSGGLPVYVNYDIPVAANLSVAPSVQTNLDGFNWITPAVKVDYYFDELFGLPDAWDVYAGGNLGFTIWMNNYYNGASHSNGIHIGIEIGGRWWFNDKWGLNLELSGGTGFGTKFGMSMKM